MEGNCSREQSGTEYILEWAILCVVFSLRIDGGGWDFDVHCV